MPQRAEQLRAADPVALLEWVDELADRFEAAWEAGGRPQITDYLDGSDGERRAALLRELATIDFQRRQKAGEDPGWDEYVQRFPELLQPGPPAVDLLDTARSSHLTRPAAREGGQSPPPLPPPRRERPRVAGYEILEELGQGAMGTAYKARQVSLKRLVALKVMRSARLANPLALARCRMEAEAAARLQHPHIVQIYEVGDQDGEPYLALEYIDGGTLEGRLGGKPQPGPAAAELVETLARAMHYAHQHGVVHRDLKPANILLTGEGVPKITDFGLAKILEGEPGQTLPGTIVGTPSYMAPEQAEGKAREVGPAADVYALGAILYELLTGRPPFRGASLLETLEQVRSEDPVPPSRLLPKLPRDLETICLKAMARAPARRYASAGALADDLRRFLNHEPIQARPVGPAERLARWCRRHPARGGLVAAISALLVTVVVASVLVALASTAQERTRRREGLVRQLQVVRATPHVNGWSAEAWKLVTEAAGLGKDETLRTLAAATGAGLDARPGRHLERVSVSWMAFDASGTRLLLGGRGDVQGRPLEGAKLWDLSADSLEVSWQAGPGPVAFRRDGTPVHLVPRDGPSQFLWDLAGRRAVGECRFGPVPGQAAPSALARNELDFPVLTLSNDATLAAAATLAPGGGRVAAWEAGSGRLLFQAEQQAGALAFAPAGNLLAGSDPQGSITLWSVPEGRVTATLPPAGVTVHCLAFSPDGRRLAVGDSAGAVTVWDVPARLPVTYCYGSHQDVYAVAFSPDGSLLASGGRGPVRLWDAATGRLVLSLQSAGLVTSLVFAPDAGRLVVGCKGPARVSVWDLDHDRGIQTLRGLTSQAAHLCLSEDGRSLAAVAHNWQVAVWDLETGSLRLLLPGPRGGADDDAALAFGPDGRQLACSAGEGAKLWDATTGAELGSWSLPAGAKDLLAFHPSGQLLLFRSEGQGGAPPPGDGTGNGDTRPAPVPVWLVRNLLGPRPTEPVARLADFDRHLLDAAVTPDGRALILEGVSSGPRGPARSIRAYDGPTGAARWAVPSTRSPLAGTLALDPTGRLLAVRTENGDASAVLLDVDSGTARGPVRPFPTALSPEARDLILAGPSDLTGDAQGYALFGRGDPAPRLVLGIDSTPSFQPVFSRDGNLLAWSNTDGTISVCRLHELRARLARAGLDW
jgi:WD40 repeat protein/tRNA A-37 threonylcarbamoyl transferase component Bud32